MNTEGFTVEVADSLVCVIYTPKDSLCVGNKRRLSHFLISPSNLCTSVKMHWITFVQRSWVNSNCSALRGSCFESFSEWIIELCLFERQVLCFVHWAIQRLVAFVCGSAVCVSINHVNCWTAEATRHCGVNHEADVTYLKACWANTVHKFKFSMQCKLFGQTVARLARYFDRRKDNCDDPVWAGLPFKEPGGRSQVIKKIQLTCWLQDYISWWQQPVCLSPLASTLFVLYF